ncbi:MAG: type I secretion system permease/ATPase [Sphingomonadaceae bacterium]|nr:type I secretion system permease/ATPase [Sphingomonadaceae bacterium]
MTTPEELRQIVRRYRGSFLTVAVISGLLNMLVLGGSIYMMLVYDSVLPSHSIPTLFGLLGMLVIVYAFQGVFDYTRSSLLGHIANSFDRALSHRVQRAMGDNALSGMQPTHDGLGPMRDLESIRTFVSSRGLTTLIDLPWIPFFIGILMLLHPWIGVTALVGGALLVSLTIVANRVTRGPTARIAALSAQRNAQTELQIRRAETLTALGMRERMLARWEQTNRRYLAEHRMLARWVGTLGGVSHIGRTLLQSIILTVGAMLVIDGKASGGVIFASSILTARALAPVDQAIANWRQLAAARLGWSRLCELLSATPQPQDNAIRLPAPQMMLQVSQLFVTPPGASDRTVRGVDFSLKAGDGLAIIGPSAAGKSSLVRALLGLWKADHGDVRLDGATIDQWPMDRLGAAIGYLPQSVDLFNGTIAENISRFADAPASEDIIAAAEAAGVHDMIVRLPLGYETPVGVGGAQLSGGQQQRIALARALYGDPFLLLLDEPNSNLDADGDLALERAVAAARLRGAIVILVSHRPTALANANLMLFMRDGKQEAFGPRDEVLRRVTARKVDIEPRVEDAVARMKAKFGAHMTAQARQAS